MQRQDLFEIWAPPGAAWSLWAKPVLFAQMDVHRADTTAPGRAVEPLRVPDGAWAPAGDCQTFMVVDLPGADAVCAGLALARRGYRPVPLFNACTDARELVDQSRIQRALVDGAAELRALNLSADAPPAFLLDETRSMYRGGVPGDFDNRWRVYADDFPSAELLRARGLARMVLVRSGRQPVPADLWMVLWDWRQVGIELLCKDMADLPQPLTLPAPTWLRRTWERMLTALGLRRAPAGGFGHRIPSPSHG